jgi:hypothetical protein
VGDGHEHIRRMAHLCWPPGGRIEKGRAVSPDAARLRGGARFAGDGSKKPGPRRTPQTSNSYLVKQRTLPATFAYTAGETVSLQGEAHAWLRGPNYDMLRPKLENAHSAVEAATIEAEGRAERVSGR